MPKALIFTNDGKWRVDPSLGGQFASAGVYWLREKDDPVDPIEDVKSPIGWRERTSKEIEDRDFEPLRLAKLSEVRSAAQSVILTRFPDWYQRNCALGVYGDAALKKCRDFIIAVVAESDRCEDLIERVSTCSEIAKIKSVWPACDSTNKR